MRPIIGIPCFTAERAETHRPIYGNNQAYARAVERAGGVPLLIPPLPDESSMRAICDRLDGLLLTGGEDVDPDLYGEQPIPECGAPDRQRDELELTFTRLALDADMPLLGVCRGMQLLNVARGGSLYQDLGAQQPHTQQHAQVRHPRSHRAHDIRILPDSRLAAILDMPSYSVNSLHHQAVNRLGDGIRIVAWSPDGVAEAMELPAYSFALAVQYHPEELGPTDEASRRLFAAFVRACIDRAPLRNQGQPAAEHSNLVATATSSIYTEHS
ncbi:MAG: gamma-glutamyl-gamma-aminobutyrate hydrolase family protein [Ktedonobacterales bacterium]